MQVQSDYDVQVNWDGRRWEPDDVDDDTASVPVVGTFDDHWSREFLLLLSERPEAHAWTDPQAGRLYLMCALAPANEDQTAEWRAEVEQLVADTNWRATRLRR